MATNDSRYAYEPLLSNGGSNHVNRNQLKKTSYLFLVPLIAKWGLKITMFVVFISWVALFFVAPTDFGTTLYNDWVAATSGTLFGETGSVLLLYGGPILIIAFLAVPYLIIFGHEEEQQQQFQKKKAPRFRLWTFPVLVDGPFGVVNAAEFFGIILIVVFILWALYIYTVANFAMLPSYGDLTLKEKRVFMLQMSAYCFGLITLSCLAFLFLPITRGSILLRLIGIPFEHTTRYHVWLGNLVMFLSTMHGLCYMIVWTIRGIVASEIIEWKSDGGANFAGFICYVFGLIIWVTTLPPIRKRCFELFFFTHQLYILFVIFLALHIGDVYFSKAAGGIFLFLLDRFLRFCQSRRKLKLVSMTCFPCGTVKLVLPKPKNLQYNALGFIFLQIPEISRLQWHPFSVSSSPLGSKHHLSVLIKAVGGWTKNLRDITSHAFTEESETVLSSPRLIMASVEGPYGHESPYYLMYERLILIAGGSGISPFLAILNDIFHRIKEKKTFQPRHVLLVWTVKSSNELSLLSQVDVGSIFPTFSNRLNIEIRIYVTRESEPPMEEGKVSKITSTSSVFSISNSGIMSTLVGRGNKIWAGSYVIISTIGFVICLALLDIWYINPYGISYWWYKGLLFLGCMVISVITFGGLVIIFWHLCERRTSSKDESERVKEGIEIVQHNESVTNESLTQETLCSPSIIHYGYRPDFTEIFGSIWESAGEVDISVIVCGPATIQSSVARECRSRNLERRINHPIFHFNSHSFVL